jgi:hypothetical protein
MQNLSQAVKQIWLQWSKKKRHISQRRVKQFSDVTGILVANKAPSHDDE